LQQAPKLCIFTLLQNNIINIANKRKKGYTDKTVHPFFYLNNTTQMKKIAIYARVSTNNGTQDYQRQINDLTSVILNHGYTEDQIEIFAEKISGYTKKDDREELSNLINIIEKDNKHFEKIYCTEISRLGRNPIQVRQTTDYLDSVKVPVFISSLGRATLNPDGSRDFVISILLTVLMEFAHLESEQLKERSRSGLRKSALDGKAGGSRHLPYGYAKAPDKMLIVDKEEAEVVRLMFQLYKEGNGVKIINGVLNQKGIPTRYNKAYAGQTIKFNVAKDADKIKWSDKTVLDIITNPLYKGQRRFKGELIAAPRIISDELFDECEQIRLNKTHRNNLTEYTYLFKDIIKCGCCNRNYYGRYKPVEGGDKIYFCSSSRFKGARCPNKGVNIMLLETAVYNELCSTEAVLKYISETKEIKKQLEQDVNRLEHQLRAEECLLPAKQAEKKRLLDLVLSDIIGQDAFKEKNEQLEIQLSNIAKKTRLIKKELSDKKILLSKQTGTGATKRMLLEAATNRTELASIFKQIIHKVIINDLSSRYCLATVYLQLNGVVLKVPLKVIIDKISIRKKVAKYTTLRAMVHEPVFNENVLLVDKQDILNELAFTIQEKGWIIVDTLLEVEPKEDIQNLHVA
jgi:site-specific DNA recombinase